jgi:hypothetical protein
MIKAFALTLFSFVLAAAGFYLGFLYLAGEEGGGKPILLIGSLPLIIVGIWLLLRSSKTNALLGLKDEVVTELAVPINGDKLENVIQKQNKIVEEWMKQSEDKDKLKILEIAAAAEEEARKNKMND